MKVLLVSTYFPLSRSDFTRSFVYYEACTLVKQGVGIYVGRWSHIRNKLPVRTRVIDGVLVHDIKFNLADFLFSLTNIFELSYSPFFRPKEIGVLLSYSKGVEKLAKKYNVNITHAHFAYPEGYVGLLTKKRTGKPLVVTLHGVDILVEPAVKYGCRLDPKIDLIVRRVLRDADRVIAASSATYKKALELGCSASKLILIPNAVDVKRFNLGVSGFPVREMLGLGKKPVIFILGAHEPHKGIKYLIKAIPTVLKDVPNAFFLIGGDGSLRSSHEVLVKELGVSENVIFTGYIPLEETPQFYAACDIFVVPSVVEAFGLVTIEAMACGKPVIGTNVGGIPDIIEDGVNGYLVKTKDFGALAEKILILLKDSDLREKMGKAGRETVEKKFNIKYRAEKIIKLYNSLG